MERVVFLDRDGTLNEEVNYLHRKEDMRLLPGVPEAIRMLREHGYRIVVITNQAGVARGYYSEEDVHALHAYMNEILEPQGAKIDAFFYCPHHPEHGIGAYKKVCHCRKPDTGMFEQAEEVFQVDKAHSWMIGDKLIDVQAGRNYGVRTVLVGTGYGAEEHAKECAKAGTPGDAKECAKSGAPGDVKACEKDETPGSAKGGNAYDVYAETLMDAARAIVGAGDSGDAGTDR
ncbi:MAG: D-glycero-beta-D-manno-heptose 1,7-bisphosphate 7-phosphatase [Eubacteriales bacterium]|nr:D-glycero-beta-D-manno-heptose 1,7-bisphosphate 7-phosphatase [Eubacteriales bacterium]